MIEQNEKVEQAKGKQAPEENEQKPNYILNLPTHSEET